MKIWEFDMTKQERQLHDLIHDLELSLAQRTTTDVEAVLADCFIEHGSSGTIYNKNDVLEAFKHFEVDKEIQLIDFKIDIKSDTLIHATYKTLKKDKNALRSSIWEYIADRWQMTFHQGTRYE